MSPVLLIIDSYVFTIYSNEESRAHVHVTKAGKRIKIWLEPDVKIVTNSNYGFNSREIRFISRSIYNNLEYLIDKYYNHVGKNSGNFRKWNRNKG